MDPELSISEKLTKLSKDEKSLLLYFETCSVDYAGRVNGLRMNKEDRQITSVWASVGFIEYGRIAAAYINSQGANYVKLSDEAFEMALLLRRQRADRLWGKRIWHTTKEKQEAPVEV